MPAGGGGAKSIAQATDTLRGDAAQAQGLRGDAAETQGLRGSQSEPQARIRSPKWSSSQRVA
jgi:hypothetical protein